MRRRPMALAAGLAAVSLASAAGAADIPERLAAISTYAGTIESILADGLGAGDLAAVEQTTASLAALVDGVVPPEMTGRYAECGVEIMATIEYVAASLARLKEAESELDSFRTEVAVLRRGSDACLEVWNETQ